MLNRRNFYRLVLKWAFFFLILYFCIIFLIRGSGTDSQIKRFQAPTFNLYKCPAETSSIKEAYRSSPIKSKRTLLYKRILLIANVGSSYQKSIFALLEYLKFPIRVEFYRINGQLPILKIAGEGQFNLIVFDDYRLFDSLSGENKIELLNYCDEYGIGMISFLFSNVKENGILFPHFTAKGKQFVKNLRFMVDSGVNFIAKSSIGFLVDSYTQDWTLFSNITGQSILVASNINNDDLTAALLVRECFNVSHIIFGQNLEHWIMKVAFMDALIYLNVADWDLERFYKNLSTVKKYFYNFYFRYIQIDIDDIFVGQSGTKLTNKDVRSLIETQKDLRNYIENFTFLLGFSGYFFRNGDSLEISGDEELIGKINFYLKKFIFWF